MSRKWLPEEIGNLFEAIGKIGLISRMARNHSRAMAINLFFLSTGFIIGYFLAPQAQDKITDSLLTFCGIMVGFIINAMLFSGRSPAADRLETEQANLYATKIRHILLSQIQTLISYFFCLTMCLIFIIIKNSKITSIDSLIFFSMATGFFSLGTYRMLFLPFQIYEIHDFALDALLKEKEKQDQERTEKAIAGFKPVKK